MRKVWAFSLLVMLGTLSFVHAASDEFLIRTQIGNDDDPPTVPTPITATALSASQIDVTWGSSTDTESSVAGYQLFRDTVQIATTTSLTYSDTGLAASTTYTYFVRAFDTFENISSSSATSTATTFAPPPPEPIEPPISGTRVSVLLEDLFIQPGTGSARFRWKTTAPASFVLRYGKTSAYDDGSVQSDVLKYAHDTLLFGLEPDTEYEYELWAYNRRNSEFMLKRGTFRTLAEADLEEPPNVGNFTADPVGQDVSLHWMNPELDDFAYVRVMRNHRFFPTDPNDGFLVYEGSADSFFDAEAFREYSTQYYTIFVYDVSGNRSSGAVALAREMRDGVPVEDLQVPGLPGGMTPTSTASSGVIMADLSFDMLSVVQSGRTLRAINDTLRVRAGEPFLLRAPYDAFPQHLKVITVTLAHPEDTQQVFSFLLRADESFEQYDAYLSELQDIGTYPLILTVFDVNTQALYSVTGSLEVEAAQRSGTGPVGGGLSLSMLYGFYGLLISFLTLSVLFMVLKRRRREDNIPTAY